MKKLKLKALDLGANEVLSRAQLRNILGGSIGSEGSGGGGSGLGWGNNVCSATASCGLSTISCTGKGYCRGRDGHDVVCFDGFGNPSTTTCH